ncbi:MAG TPA: hypothetical protein VE220_03400, partial [Gaiellaceae bacterium]|nr:hypothetical protein [Gaiellaceae bacterium]
MRPQRTKVQAWLWGEILLAGLLGASLALFVSHPVLRTQWDEPALLLVLKTTMALVGLLVAVLAANRFQVDGLRTDLLLAAGFLVESLSTAAFAILPALGGGSLKPSEAWMAALGGILGGALVAAAPFVGGRSRSRERALWDALGAAAVVLLA